MELPKILGFIGVGMAGFTSLFAILAAALPSWQTAENTEIGIWKVCINYLGIRVCGDIELDTLDDKTATNTKAVRAMCILGILCIVAAIGVAILKLFVMKTNKTVGFVAGGLALVAGLWFMVGFAVFADKVARPDALGIDYNYGAAFALEVMAWLLAWVAGGLFLAETLMGGGEA